MLHFWNILFQQAVSIHIILSWSRLNRIDLVRQCYQRSNNVASVFAKRFFSLLPRDQHFVHLKFVKSNNWIGCLQLIAFSLLTISSISSFFTWIFCSSCSLANFSAVSLFRLSPKIFIAYGCKSIVLAKSPKWWFQCWGYEVGTIYIRYIGRRELLFFGIICDTFQISNSTIVFGCLLRLFILDVFASIHFLCWCFRHCVLVRDVRST